MLVQKYILVLFAAFALISCDDSETDFPEPEVTLFDKTWVASTGTESIRFRLNTDGTYNGGNDEGFPDQGFWNWADVNEDVMIITYDTTTVWYRFEDLTSNSLKRFVSETNQPYEWGDGVLFSLSD
jgi:hypothetical protein